MPELQIRKAVRRALPMQIGIYGPSGSGKTLSALLLAAGLKPNAKIMLIDTERGKGSIHADSPSVLKYLPQGYDTIELDPPYHPQRFIEALQLVERNKYDVCIVDSESDSWEGPGGCFDIAETDGKGKGLIWNNAKRWNKRYKIQIALSEMHVISLFKAQEKTKIIDKNKSASGKQEYIELGVLPIGEKNAFYPLLVGFSVDPITHMATLKKGAHENLPPMFPQPKLLSKSDGEKLRVWNDGGKPLEADELLAKRAAFAAEAGVAEYQKFWTEITKEERVALASKHEDNKKVAAAADKKETNDPKGDSGNNAAA